MRAFVITGTWCDRRICAEHPLITGNLHQQLVKNGYEPCYVNFPAYSGEMSDAELGKLPFQAFVDHAVKRYRECESPPVIIGHSKGGLIALILATIVKPAAVVLLAPAPPKGIRLLFRPPFLLDLLAGQFMRAMLGGRAFKPSPRVANILLFNKLKPAIQNYLNTLLLKASGKQNWELLLGVPLDGSELNCPILLLAGTDDRIVPFGVAEDYSKKYPLELYPVEGAGHMLFLEPDVKEQVYEKMFSWLRNKLS